MRDKEADSPPESQGTTQLCLHLHFGPVISILLMSRTTRYWNKCVKLAPVWGFVKQLICYNKLTSTLCSATHSSMPASDLSSSQ